MAARLAEDCLSLFRLAILGLEWELGLLLAPLAAA
jgi:hypothetical protein